MAWERTAAQVYKGGPSGTPSNPSKDEIRPLLKQYENAIDALGLMLGASQGAVKALKSQLLAVAGDFDTGDVGVVFADSNSNNGVYVQNGSTFVKDRDLPGFAADAAAAAAEAYRDEAKEFRDDAKDSRDDALSYRNSALSYRNAAALSEDNAFQSEQNARAAAEASGSGVTFFDTKALATAGLSGVPANGIVEVFVDEDYGGVRTRYRKESGVLVFKRQVGMDIDDRYSPNWTGATPTIIRDVFGDSVRLREFVGTGDALSGDTGTDYTDAIQGGLLWAARRMVPSDARRGVAILGHSGDFGVTRQITIPHGVVLRGTGRSFKLRALPTFDLGSDPEDAYMIRIGLPDEEAFNTRLQTAYLECSDIDGLGGVYSEAAEECSGLHEVIVNNYRGKLAYFKGPNIYPGASFCSDLFIWGLQAFPSELGSLGGIHFDGVANVCNLAHIQIGDARRSGTNPWAIRLNGSQIDITSFHMEKHTTGLQINGTSKATARGLFGHSTVTNVVELASGWTGGVNLGGIFRNSATKTILDSAFANLYDSTLDHLSGFVFNYISSGVYESMSSDPAHRWQHGTGADFKGSLSVTRTSGSNPVLRGLVGSETNPRIQIYGDGSIAFSAGATAEDLKLLRLQADLLGLEANDSFRIVAGTGTYQMASPNGTIHYLWVDDSGKWRTATSAPGVNKNTAGTVVGTQS